MQIEGPREALAEALQVDRLGVAAAVREHPLGVRECLREVDAPVVPEARAPRERRSFGEFDGDALLMVPARRNAGSGNASWRDDATSKE